MRYLVAIAAMALVGCGEGGCGSSKDAPEGASSAMASATGTTKATADGETEPPTLCERLADDETLELARLTHGDVMAFAVPSTLGAPFPDPGEDELAAVIEAARELEAESVSKTLSGDAWVFHDRAMVPRAIAGVPPQAAGELAKRLVSGRFAEDAGEVVLSETDARRLGLPLGGEVVLAVTSGVDVASAKHEVVGLLRVEGVLGGDGATAWLTASGAEALLAVSDHATAARVMLPAKTERAAWAKQLAQKVGRKVRVLTHDELQSGLLAAASELKAMCRDAAPATNAPVVARAELSCAHLATEGTGGSKLLVDLMGDVALAPTPTGAVDTTWLPEEAERRSAYSFEGHAMTQAAVAPVKVAGLPSPSREALADHVVEGKLLDVGVEGGAAVSRALAVELGVRVGDTITLALRPAGSQGALEKASVKLAALVGPVGDPLFSLRDIVILDRDYAATLDPRSPQAAWIFVRAGSAKVDELLEVAPSVVMARDLRRTFAEASADAQRVLAKLCEG